MLEPVLLVAFVIAVPACLIGLARRGKGRRRDQTPACTHRAPTTPGPPPAGSIREELVRIGEHIRQAEEAADEKICLVIERVTADMAQHIHQLSQSLSVDLGERMDRLQQGVTASLERALQTGLGELKDQLTEATSDAARKTILRPIVDQLVAMRDRVLAEREFLSASYHREPELHGHLGCRQLHQQAEAVLTSLSQELLSILRQLDVIPIQAPAGQFNPRHQQIVSVEPTSDPQRDGHVSKILRPGYLWCGTVLRPEWVVVYKLTKEK